MLAQKLRGSYSPSPPSPPVMKTTALPPAQSSLFQDIVVFDAAAALEREATKPTAPKQFLTVSNRLSHAVKNNAGLCE